MDVWAWETDLSLRLRIVEARRSVRTGIAGLVSGAADFERAVVVTLENCPFEVLALIVAHLSSELSADAFVLNIGRLSQVSRLLNFRAWRSVTNLSRPLRSNEPAPIKEACESQVLDLLSPWSLQSFHLIVSTEPSLIEKLSRFFALRHLSLDLCHHESFDLTPLSRLTNLRSLEFEGHTNIKSSDYHFISSLTRLEVLNLRWGAQVSNVEFGPIASNCTSLRILSLKGSIGGYGFLEGTGAAQHITNLTKLVVLELTNHHHIGKRWDFLAPLTNLRHLSLQWTDLDYDAARYFENLTNLYTLELEGTKLHKRRNHLNLTTANGTKSVLQAIQQAIAQIIAECAPPSDRSF